MHVRDFRLAQRSVLSNGLLGVKSNTVLGWSMIFLSYFELFATTSRQMIIFTNNSAFDALIKVVCFVNKYTHRTFSNPLKIALRTEFGSRPIS